MKNETKMQVMDFIGFLETSGKLNTQEHKRLREALEGNLPQKESPELPNKPLTRSEVADFLKVKNHACQYADNKKSKINSLNIYFQTTPYSFSQASN